LASDLRSVLAIVTALASVPALARVPASSRAPVAGATGGIRGQVVAIDPAPPPARPRVSDLAGVPYDPVDRRRSVVFIDSWTHQAFEGVKPGRARLDQRGQQFIPRVLAITVGSTVELPNNDTTFHNAFSLAPSRTFDLGRYPPGRTKSVRFDQPGIVPVFCDIHSHMSAYVLVFSHPFFAVTDEAGRYTISGVPAGTYVLAIWSELGRAAKRPITVVDGEFVEAPFQLTRGKS
jgi:plastocyanin